MFGSLLSKIFFVLIILGIGMAVPLGFAAALEDEDDLLTEIQDRGFIRCGVSDTDLPGFAEHGQGPWKGWKGHDVDYCRAVAAAIFGDEKKRVRFVTTTAGDRFERLRDEDVDLLVRVTTHTLSRDAAYVEDGEHTGQGGDFAPTIFYDGQGFLSDVTGGVDIETPADLADELDGMSVCVRGGTTTIVNLEDFASENEINITIVETDDIIAEYQTKDANDQWICDFATSDQSALYASLAEVTNVRNKTIVFKVTISKEPLAPMVRQGGESERFEDVVRWVVYATFFGEERDINYENVTDKHEDPVRDGLNSEEKRFLGLEGDLGEKLGLDNDWAYDVIRLVGNHDDIFFKNLEPLGFSPGINQPPPEGLMYSPPFR